MSGDTVTVLVIDDEPQIRRLVRNALTADSTFARIGWKEPRGEPAIRVVEAATGQEGIDRAASEAPSIVILDLGLPDMEGVEVCRELRRWSAAPIIVLSARQTDTEKVTLLDTGADDYVTKPFSSVELVARVRAQLRRVSGRAGSGPSSNTILSFGDVSVDLQRRRVERDGTLIHLTPTEWALLCALLAHPGQTLTHHQLFSAVWGNNTAGDAQQYLRVYVGHLRRKIEVDPLRPQFIHTEAGVGYRFEPTDKQG